MAGKRSRCFNAPGLKGLRAGKAREVGKTAGRRSFDARQRRGRLEEEDGAARWGRAGGERERKEGKLGRRGGVWAG
jgi:hypothetical protein